MNGVIYENVLFFKKRGRMTSGSSEAGGSVIDIRTLRPKPRGLGNCLLSSKTHSHIMSSKGRGHFPGQRKQGHHPRLPPQWAQKTKH